MEETTRPENRHKATGKYEERKCLGRRETLRPAIRMDLSAMHADEWGSIRRPRSIWSPHSARLGAGGRERRRRSASVGREDRLSGRPPVHSFLVVAVTDAVFKMQAQGPSALSPEPERTAYTSRL
ncbi:hypothetical protein SRM_02452 [Salinibacter ruber M8]|uniref:Uncharacterized protein n=1 Tax=Salinibacter ruber (strain M8) TaxID=761659 RepID=D5HBG8_SALRM|nr:hypothetical protein SRM_02452 [Salinibacter ruber M8]